MKSILMRLVAVVFAAGVALAADPVNKLCPVRAGKAGNPTKIASYSKGVAFCSAACKNKFEKAPNSFGKELAAYKSDSKKCLLDGKPAAAGFESEYKADVTFCCNNCKGSFEREPDKYIEKALKK